MHSFRSSFRLRFFSVLLTLFGTFSLARGAIGDGFDPRFNHNVYATAVHPDGSLFVGGAFTTAQAAGTVQETAHSYLARIRPDGSVDEAFDVHFDADVTAILVQADGRILVGGRFTRYTSHFSPSGVERRGLARLNPDGSLDESFVAHTSGNPLAGSPIYALAQQKDGKLLVGGSFMALQGPEDASPVARQRIARLHSDGSIDLSFDLKANNWVYAILIQADQRIVIGGGFTTLQPLDAESAVERRRIARINPDGSLDPDFSPRADNRVLALVQQADGMIVAGGDFRTLQTDADETAITRNFLARIRADGSIDGNYNPSANASVAVLLPQRDGTLLAGGSFSAFRPSSGSLVVSRRYIARIQPDGSIDESFAAYPNAPVTSLALQANDHILLGGVFTGVQLPYDAVSTTRMRLARLYPDGSLDTAFGTSATNLITRAARQSDGKWVVGGLFSHFAGATRSNLARIEADGTLDLGFNPSINGRVDTVVLQSDGKILIGGVFTTVNSVDRTYLARLNSDGSLDTTFHPQPFGSVYTLVVQADGRILVGGTFLSFDPDDNDDTATVSRSYLARLNADGSLDTAFQPGTNGSVYSLTLQSDGKLLIAGEFTSLQGTGQSAETRAYFGRLNANGTLDATFNPNPNAPVYAVALQADGSTVIAGSFSTLNPNPVANSSVTPVDRIRVARVLSDGKLDTGFDPSPDGPVSSVHIDTAGRIYLGGTFLTVGATARQRFARLNSDGSVDSSFEMNANEAVLHLAADPAGNLLVTGSFTTLQPAGGNPLPADDHLALLDAGGAPVPAFRVKVGADFAGEINSLAFQADGQLLAGGAFRDLAGDSSYNLARFTATGSTDSAFNPRPDATVHSILVQPEIYPGGHGKLFAWLNANGTFSSGFSLDSISRLSGQIAVMALQPDGRLVVGGSFTDTATGAGYPLARYMPDGSVDTSFNPAPDGVVTALALQSDGKLLVGGTFLNIAGGVRHRIARLNSDGSLDETFNPKANAQVNVFAVQADDRILIGGSFTSLDPNSIDDADVDVTTRNCLARLNADGTVDTSFTTQANATVYALAVLESGQILVGGAFTTLGDQTRNGLGRLSSSGAIESFNPNVSGTVASIGLQSDGRLVIGGVFTAVNPNTTDTDTAVTRNNLARLNADGTLDAAFDPNANGYVNAVVIGEHQRIYIAGGFTTLTPNGSSEAILRNRIARLTPDGGVDTGFNPNSNGVVNTLLAGPDDTILLAGSFTALRPEAVIWIGGDFANIGGISSPHLAKLNLDGNGDSTFLPLPNGSVHAMVLGSNGTVIAAGNFTAIGDTPRNYLARFERDGSLDSGFAPPLNGPVSALAIDASGRVLLGGDFTSVGNLGRAHLARLLSDGSADASFSSSSNGSITALFPLRDGRILVAGAFTRVAGGERVGLARLQADGTLDLTFDAQLDGPVSSLHVQADGSILIGGAFTQVGAVSRAGFAKIDANGNPDAALIANVDREVRTIATLSDGNPVLGGTFTQVDNRSRLLLARIGNSAVGIESVAVGSDLQSLTFTRRGATPEVTAVAISYSADGQSWTPLGNAVRQSGRSTWTLALASPLPAQANYSLRTEGVAPVSRQASSGLLVRSWHFFGTVPSGNPPLTTLEDTLGDEAFADSGNGTSGTGGSSGDSEGGSSSGTGSETTAPSEETLLGPSRLVNISARVALRPQEVVIVGFHVSGNTSQHVLIRGVGPGLAPFGVDDIALSPELELFNAEGTSMQKASGWTEQDGALFAQVGAFALTPGDGDSALSVTLAPGSYTVHARDRQGLGGTLLIEAYAAEPALAGNGVLSSLSTRAMTASGSGVLIAGLVIEGQSSQSLLLRGIGPSLAEFGVTGTVDDPVLRVFDSSGRLIAMNDNWSSDANAATTVSSAARATGAFPLPEGSADSALLVTLGPGAYTLQLTDKQGNSGDSLIEVYTLTTR